MHHTTRQTTVGELRKSEPAKLESLGLTDAPDGMVIHMTTGTVETESKPQKPTDVSKLLKAGQKIVPHEQPKVDEPKVAKS